MSVALFRETCGVYRTIGILLVWYIHGIIGEKRKGYPNDVYVCVCVCASACAHVWACAFLRKFMCRSMSFIQTPLVTLLLIIPLEYFRLLL